MPDCDDLDVTDLLLAWRRGDQKALAELIPLVYRRLKEIAGYLIQRERQGHTLDATALVHEVYLRVVDLGRVGWQDRAHFFAMCARIMRRVLVEHARHHGREKRGADLRIDGVDLGAVASPQVPHLTVLDDALKELAEHDRQKAEIVELRFFGGLDREEIAEVLGIGSATVTRRWRSARVWLIQYLRDESA